MPVSARYAPGSPTIAAGASGPLGSGIYPTGGSRPAIRGVGDPGLAPTGSVPGREVDAPRHKRAANLFATWVRSGDDSARCLMHLLLECDNRYGKRTSLNLAVFPVRKGQSYFCLSLVSLLARFHRVKIHLLKTIRVEFVLFANDSVLLTRRFEFQVRL